MTRIFATLCLLGAIIMPLNACAKNDETTKSPSIFTGVWKNDRGSEVTFNANAGRLSGYYQTNVGQPDKSQKFPLTGLEQGDQITFTVNFGQYGSMTSWTGQLTEDATGPYIRTLWHLTRDVPDDQEDDDLWKSITVGASDFRPAPKR
ncbi:MAG: avidin/streptavidin family protein [Alphaproteobacteria bacterium]